MTGAELVGLLGLPLFLIACAGAWGITMVSASKADAITRVSKEEAKAIRRKSIYEHGEPEKEPSDE